MDKQIQIFNEKNNELPDIWSNNLFNNSLSFSNSFSYKNYENLGNLMIKSAEITFGGITYEKYYFNCINCYKTYPKFINNLFCDITCYKKYQNKIKNILKTNECFNTHNINKIIKLLKN